MSYAIETFHLSKNYGNGRGCQDVTLRIPAGEAFGFLGPNGAGKSTIVKMLVGLATPTDGKALLFGEPAGSVEARRRIGYLPELFRYPGWLSGEEVLQFHGKLCGMKGPVLKSRINQLLDEVGIGQRGRDRIKGYSKGMQQRLGLACALLTDPDIVFLDEPASALDPVGRHEVRELLQRLRKEGKTIFLNSHLLEDVEQLCDHVALLNNGRILADGQVSEVLRATSARWRFRVGGITPELLDWLRERMIVPVDMVPWQDGSVPEWGENWLEAELADDEQVGYMNRLLIDQGVTLYETHKVKSSLDEWFLQAVSGLEHRGENR
ncbi:ABC transporter ATP-binding protein [Paenibacillus glycanilyticus]|uniref:Multidrug ABC transporter ATP-binding protein n=1 Tax=Paenibacillus glycanilyticus TaxID=126569 RepID=A0ABQ6GA87_9BACL|nr:ABC transporter ATP-binding protein [Paenibacillus glycanilyticus]GLX67879.1 multidrug ABC transporter ATP-binding protein [Paenibacillus glycanilyticus]